MSKVKFSTKAIFGAIAGILIATASWAFYSIINEGASDLLALLGITNTYYQAMTVVIVVVILLILIGWKARKIFKSILS